MLASISYSKTQRPRCARTIMNVLFSLNTAFAGWRKRIEFLLIEIWSWQKHANMNISVRIIRKLIKENERERGRSRLFPIHFLPPLLSFGFPHSDWQGWAWVFPSSPYSALGFGLGEQRAQLILSGGLFLLHQLRVAFSDTPAVRGGHGWAERAAGGGLQLLPIITTGSGWQNNHVRLH